jgi:hypothetical protein
MMMQMRLVAPLFIENDDFKSNIVMVRKAALLAR